MSYSAVETSRYSGAPKELYKFTCGVDKFCYTSGDGSETYNTDVYAPDTIERTQIDQSQEQQAGSIDVTIMRDNAVAALFIPYLPVNPVGLTIYRRHRSDPETVTIFVGKVVTAKFEGSQVVLSCAPASQILQKKIPVNVYQRQCNLALYSTRCGVNKALFSATGNVTAVSGYTVTVPGVNSHIDGWYAGGWIERSNGDMRFITGHAGNDITLQAAFLDLTVGELVTVYAGCDRSESTCSLKFGNLVNHLGFARIPTKNPFSGSVT